MNLVEKMRNYFASFFGGPRNAVVIPETGLIDVYLERIFQIFCWESTEASLRVFFYLNTLYWIILIIELKVYGVVSLLGLIIFLYDALQRETLYADYKGEYSAIIRGIKTASSNATICFYNLRKDSPLVFYPSAILFFLILRVISKSISTSTIIYFLFVGSFLAYIMIRSCPNEWQLEIQRVFETLRSPRRILAEDELIPFIQGKDFNKRDADLESLLTDRTADSVTNSLASGISSMPSYLEIAEAPNDIQEEDLLPRPTKSGPSFTPGELSSDSDSENREIKFDSDHFNLSSSDEDPYSKDLSFPNTTLASPRENEATLGMFRSLINTVNSNIVTNMFQSAIYSNREASTSNTAPSESDSDFEIVDPEEIAGDFKRDD